ncbi:hypothetical protein DFQ30_005922, partial [Apophysomyces sp. BC1015]
SEITFTGYRVPIEFLYHSRRNETETDPGLQAYKPIYSVPSFQNGRCTSFERGDRAWGLFSQDRFEGCVFGHTNPPRFPEIYILHTSGNGVPVQDSAVWSQCSPTGLLQVDVVCRRAITQAEHPT